MNISDNKIIYLTLDFEEDVGSASQEKTFYSHRHSDQFVRYINDNNLKVTLFITGEIIDKRPELLEPYMAYPDNFEFEFHSYDHSCVYDSHYNKIALIKKGLEAYQHFFGRNPLLYRAPDGVISKEEIVYLIDQGIHFGSNIFPTLFPGRFNNANAPQYPFRLTEDNYIEIPFSVTKYFRIPVSLSYIQLIGMTLFQLINSSRGYDRVIFDFHLHDLYTKEWYGKKKMRLQHTLGYFRASYQNGIDTFKKVVDYFMQNGYSFDLLKSLVKELQQKPDIPALSLEGVYS